MITSMLPAFGFLAFILALVAPGHDALAKAKHYCIKTGNGRNFLNVNPGTGVIDAAATKCEGNAVFAIDLFSRSRTQPPKLAFASVMRAANGRWVAFDGTKLTAAAAQLRNDKRFQFHIYAVQSQRYRHGSVLPVKAKLRIYPAISRFKKMLATVKGGGSRALAHPASKAISIAREFSLVSAPPPAPPAPKPWAAYGGEYGAPDFHREGDLVIATGVIKGGVLPTLWSVPKALVPGGRRIFNLNNHDKSARADMMADGKLVWQAGGRSRGMISLSGVRYSMSPTGRLPLRGGFKPFPQADGVTASYTRQGKLVMLEGAMRSKSLGTFIAKLPKEVRPRTRLSFSQNSHDGTVRIEINKDGSILWPGRGHSKKIVSLSGIIYALKQDARISLENGWKFWRAGGYPHPSVARQGKVVVLAGTVDSGKRGLIGRLPDGYRPAKRLVFAAYTIHAKYRIEGHARIDILPDGRILYVKGPRRHPTHVTLEGIAFRTDQAAPKPQTDTRVSDLQRKIKTIETQLKRNAAAEKKHHGDIGKLQKQIAAKQAELARTQQDAKKMTDSLAKAKAALKKLGGK